MTEQLIDFWGKDNFQQGLLPIKKYENVNHKFTRNFLDAKENFLFYINKEFLGDIPPYSEKNFFKFMSDGKVFYFILRPNPAESSSHEKPYIVYSDHEEQEIIPIYSQSSCLMNWIDYEIPWNVEKEVLSLDIKDYRLFMVYSKTSLDREMRIQVCNLYQSNTTKPLYGENVVCIIGKNYTLNGSNYTFDEVNYRAHYNLSEINISTNDFVNIIYFEKK